MTSNHTFFDDMTTRCEILKEGFDAGLEEAAEYHNCQGNRWFDCANGIGISGIDRREMEKKARIQYAYAEEILELKETKGKERSSQHGSTDRDDGPSQEDPPQKGP